MKKLSFELREFQEAKRAIEKMQCEFCEFVSTEISKISCFEGNYTQILTGATYGKVCQGVFISHMSFDGIPVVLQFEIDFDGGIRNNCFHLKGIRISCDILAIEKRWILYDGFDDFKIYYRGGYGDICEKRVSVKLKHNEFKKRIRNLQNAIRNLVHLKG